MCVKVEPTYYRLELDDYSAAAFTSFGKYYYGTLEDLRCFFGELAHDEKLKKQFKELLSTFQAFEEGQQDLSHSIAYRKVPFLVPVQLLHREPVTLENYKWTHINTWDRPYYMRCDEVKSEHLWLACDGEYCRATKAMFSRLQYNMCREVMRYDLFHRRYSWCRGWNRRVYNQSTSHHEGCHRSLGRCGRKLL